MKRLAALLLYLFCNTVNGQSSDFILLKKKGVTVQTYFPGSRINFTAASGAYIEADILSIRHDTLLLKQYVVRQVPTQLGIYILDTGVYYYRYNYKDIRSIGRTGRRFDWTGSGGALMGGGALLTVASGIVYLADHKKFSPGLLGASVGLMGVGYLLSSQSGKGMAIGKKYSLTYIAVAESKKAKSSILQEN